jgi:hypothetical protein
VVCGLTREVPEAERSRCDRINDFEGRHWVVSNAERMLSRPTRSRVEGFSSDWLPTLAGK